MAEAGPPAPTCVLAVAGLDSGGGAGVLRDAATIAAAGCTARVAVTAVTAQTDAGLRALHPVPAEVVAAQIAAAVEGGLAAVKIGMLCNAGIVGTVAAALAAGPAVPVVLDPVLASSSGATLLDADGRGALMRLLLPRVTLLTPNLPEAAALTGRPDAATAAERVAQAAALLDLGAAAVLLKGGHAAGAEATDWLYRPGAAPVALSAPRLPRGRRGTGCTLASAIASALAKGATLEEACRRGKEVTQAYIVAGL